MAQLSFDELSEEEKADVVAFYNSQGMNTGSPITEATLPPASRTLSPPPVTATSLDTGEPVSSPSSSWRDAPVATEVSPTRGIMTDAPDMDEVQAFQERNGLPRDGVLDENTFRAMTAQALAQPSSADAPPVEQENPPQPASEEAPATYLIQSGDTFSKIAAENPFTLNQLIAANPDITDPNNVMIGQEINLPVGGAPVVEAPVVEAPVVEVPVVEVPAVETTETTQSTDANNLTFRAEAVSSPTNVRSIQALIGTPVDGDWGPKSEAALKSFQEANGLSPTGDWQDPELASWIEENVPVDLTNRASTDPYRAPNLSDDNITTVSTEDWVGEDRDAGASNLFGRRIEGNQFTGTVSRINMGGEEREIIDVSDMIVGRVGVGTTMVPRVLVLHETDAVSGGQRLEYNGLGHFLNARDDVTTQWFVDQDGRIFRLTPDNRRGNHVSGMHTGSLGIEVEGLSEEGGTPEAATEAAAWLAEYLVRTNPEITHVISHHQVGRGRFGAGKDDGATQLNAVRERMGQTPFNLEDNVVLFDDFKQRALGN